jgi:class 3 adenylate cyclase
VWGDTVNVAARLVGVASPGTTALTEAAWRELGGSYKGRSLGRIEMKGKGPVDVVECAPEARGS